MRIIGILLTYITLSSCSTSTVHFDRAFGFTPMYEEGSSQSYFEKPNEFISVFPSNTYGPRGSGYNFKAHIAPSLSKVISYDVKFDEDFNFAKGGTLPGLCSNIKPEGKSGFATHLMWGVDGQVHGKINETMYDWESHQVALNFQKGVWHNIQIAVQMNDIGRNNGFIVGYFDKEVAFIKKGLNLREIETMTIDRLCFNTFFGGDDPTWASVKKEKLSLRGVKVYEVR